MSAAPPGFFGKVRSHGDFVARRLPPAFQEPWDGWLQACLLRSREALGERWLRLYLHAPLWRFALGPGVCGAQAWAGVLMPAVDRVGRYFPLTVAAPFGAVLSLRDCLGAGASWFEALEELALASLDEAFVLAQFDAALLAVDPATAPRAAGAPWVAFNDDASIEGVLAGLGDRVGPACSAWWTTGGAHVMPGLAAWAGLPGADDFTTMMGGGSGP